MNPLPLGIVLFAQQPAPDTWSETVFGLDSEQWFTLTLIAFPCLTVIILGGLAIISSAINSVHRRRVEADMKRDMIDRGMSAEEIAKVIESASPPEDATQRWIASWGCKKK